MSLMQKAIRRGRKELAFRAAATLLIGAPDKLWRRLACIAFEDVGVGDLDTVAFVTAALTGNDFARSWVGSGRLPVFSYRACRRRRSAEQQMTYTLPLWNAGRVRMLDSAKAIDQLCALRRRVGQGVQEKIVHPRNGHDDLANSVAGVLWRLSPIERQVAWDYGGIGVVSQPRSYIGDGGEASDTMQAWIATQGYTRAPDGGLGRSSARRPGSVVW